MSDLEKTLKDMLYCGVGAAATVIEKGSELAQSLVEKGQKAVEDNRATGEELKRKVKEVYEEATRVEVDVTKMTAEQRAELRRQLDMMDADDKGDNAPHNDHEEG